MNEGILRATQSDVGKMSTISQEPCPLCIQLEVGKLLSLSLELGIEPKTREDVLNLIRINDYSSVDEDPQFIESIIDAFLEVY